MGQSGWDYSHPRPQLRRDSFLSLNAGWTLNDRPIRLPWPPQAPLAGWPGQVGEELLYEKRFFLPTDFLPAGRRAVLHFGAVDQTAEVSLNGSLAVRHEGGYLPFSADVTSWLREGENCLRVRAVDTLSRDYPYGKQHKKPHGMWYTPVSGIWQTVWMETVPERGAVAALRITPDCAGITLEVETDAEAYTVAIPLAGGETLTGVYREKRVRIELPEPHLWSPEDPWLYDLTVATDTDRVESYFALRTVAVEEVNGFTRICLNGAPIFLHGVLDQGYFPDGLFLPASPEEYARDVRRMKDLGFNLLRKHVKVEPEAFYCACDRLGMLVLQDMVNSGGYSWLWDTAVPTLLSKRRSDHPGRRAGTPARRAFFEGHTLETLERLRSHPCVIGYTIFNEGWGQYDSDRIYRLCKERDPSRFYVSASGWFAQRESDVQSEHVYFRSKVLESRRPGQALLLSECGGFTRPLAGHGSDGKRRYGYGQAATEEALTGRIQALYRDMVLPSIPKGLCGCVYTQLSDVEGEVNGLYTYDRAVCKVSQAAMVQIAQEVRQAAAAAAGRSPAGAS